MKYFNPVIRGCFPDPSICYADGYYYLVCSSFQYFPGIPLFRSVDLVEWEQIGHCLTRKSQLNLNRANSSEGLFAPTIRYNEGRFYMVVTNQSGGGNFYVYTDDIMGEWSDPIFINRPGIDPSLLFDDDKVYFMSNGVDDYGKYGISLCEVNIETGEILTTSRCISQGSGGRFVEAPHLYHIREYYYLLLAEGGTEFGHMATIFRSKSHMVHMKHVPGIQY
jgi:alpha-N-arabinofuranosidase